MERVPDNKDVANPLYAGDVLIYPTGGEPLSRSADKQLGVFYTIYPGAGFAAPSATLDLYRNGRAVTSAPVSLGQRDAQGRIQQVSRIRWRRSSGIRTAHARPRRSATQTGRRSSRSRD